MNPVVVEAYLLPRCFLWAMAAAVGCFAVACALNGEWIAAVACLAFIVVYALHSVAFWPSASIEADEESIGYSVGDACWSIKWSDVSKIETSPRAIVLHGQNKKLVIPGPSMWKGEGRGQLLGLIQSQAQAHDIPQHLRPLAAFQASTNTRAMIRP